MRITSRKPQDVASEVAQQVSAGERSFVIAQIDHGGMLDQERLGAARYAAARQAEVRLEAEEPASTAPRAR